MFDPVNVTAVVSTATAAFNNLKKAFAMGRDIEQMGSDLSRWMQASSDIDQGIKNSKHPPFYKKFLKNKVKKLNPRSVQENYKAQKEYYQIPELDQDKIEKIIDLQWDISSRSRDDVGEVVYTKNINHKKTDE